MKVSIVGAGNAGCFTALYYSWHAKDIEVELIHNPDKPPVTVGQGTIPGALELLHNTTRFNWHNNKAHATPKTGFLYEGWGKINYEVMHPFPAENMAMHFCPHEMQTEILNSGRFKVTEGDVEPKDVDADYVFDARGCMSHDYIKLTSPVNSVILGKPKWNTLENLWTEGVATPNGWTFVIPMHSTSPSHKESVGYIYNNQITKTEDAEKNFQEFFEVEVTRHLTFDSYVAREPVIDDRIFLQGNKLFFLEPLESTATEAYLHWSKETLCAIMNGTTSDLSRSIKKYIRRIQNFILWHYQFGSRYDTPFWDYAQSLISTDETFNKFLDASINMSWDKAVTIDDIGYAQWPPSSFKYWHEGMTLYKGE